MPRLPFSTIQRLDLPLTEIVGGRIGFIHDLFLCFPYEVRDALPGGDQDMVVLVGKENRAERLRELSEYPGRLVLVFVPGDASVRDAYMPERRALPANVVAAYATNNELADRRAVSVPLGVRINKLRALQFVRQNHGGERDGLLYGNFALNDKHYRPDRTGSPHVRARLVDGLRDKPWASLDISDEPRDDPVDLVRFYSQIANHKFVLAPEGNGVDCYRTWEILYLGGIPIVMVSSAMSAFTGLPMLFTEDYGDISQDYLDQCWLDFSSRSFEIDRMLRSWYLHRFLESVSTLERPRFVCWQVDDSPPDKFIEALGRSSHSASGIVTETPTPPFTARLRLMQPDDWHIVGGLGLERVDEGLRISVRDEGRRLLELPLETIAGGPFRLTGRVKGGAEAASPLKIELKNRSESITSADVGAGKETVLSLDFVAKSDRTVLTVSASEEAPLGWALLSGLELHATVGARWLDDSVNHH